MSTIFAPASGVGRAGVAVVRLSGPDAAAAVRALTGRKLPSPRRAALRRLQATDGGLIDRGLVLWFPGPASFTGEDCAEFHIHGGRAVLAALLAALGRVPGCVPAGPGAFSRRAFAHGKLDLTQAEALADLVDAETDAQRRQALRQLDGAFGRLVEGWRARLMRALAHAEAEIDFPDEDLPDGIAARILPQVAALVAEIATHLADDRRGEALRDGLSVAILGPPNAGKSSLLNRLAGFEAAIVAARAGTTRDVIEVRLDLGGWPVVLADTAGLRDSDDEIEAEGVRRALARAEVADLCLLVYDATAPLPDAVAALAGPNALLVANQCDRLAGPWPPGGISALTGAGLPALLDRLTAAAAARLGGGDAAISRARHRTALAGCAAALARISADQPPELLAEDLRLAATALGQITGRTGVEDILDLVFAEFCIGK